ncbi:polysaccharide deacetylase family protein [Deinococcus planocerae]|uniref:polysaccharide deacetylase family protein n=1 Tax=Deinococcus planocerae TaxID=1737569 RepID=UPI001FE7C86C|nr:polysaccharide deacetylase family protein [Deinococcus planocerae]
MCLRPLAPLSALLLAVPLVCASNAQTPGSRPVHAQAAPTVPGEVQPVAPGVRPAPGVPTLTLSPPVPGVERVEYLGNGYIEVAHAVLTLTPEQRAGARLLMGTVARRVLAARPGLAEVDLSVYDKATYGGFGGPPPLLTASVPRARLGDFEGWVNGQGGYERAWVGPGTLPTFRAPDRVRETTQPLTPAAGASQAAQNRADLGVTTARVLGGVQGGLLFKGRRDAGRVAALTFDDAPHPLYEPLLLDLLRRTGARATFFVIGRNAQAYPYFVRDMVAGGHEVGNHTYHHVRLPPLSPGDAAEELRLASQTITSITGLPVRYFRPPGGDYTQETLSAARSQGLVTVFWTDDPGDFANPGDAVLESRLRRNLRPGGIVLLHDNAPEMLGVLRPFLRLAGREGVVLTTVGGLPK